MACSITWSHRVNYAYTKERERERTRRGGLWWLHRNDCVLLLFLSSSLGLCDRALSCVYCAWIHFFPLGSLARLHFSRGFCICLKAPNEKTWIINWPFSLSLACISLSLLDITCAGLPKSLSTLCKALKRQRDLSLSGGYLFWTPFPLSSIRSTVS